jgi:hypothetical protein
VACRTRRTSCRALGEHLDEAEVVIAEHVSRGVGIAQPMLLEMRQQLFQQGVEKTILIGEIHRAEDTSQPQVGIFNGRQRIVELLADLCSVLANGLPAMLLGDVEAVLVGIGGLVAVASLDQRRLVVLLPHVAQRFEDSRPKTNCL